MAASTPAELWGVVLVSWGHAVYSAPQLKGMQEVITLIVFAGFSTAYLGEPLKWNHWAGFALIIAAAWLIFLE